MSEPIVVNQSTSVVQVDTSTLVYPDSAVVLLSSITAPGTIITIRDITGYASINRRIVVSTTVGVHYLDGPGCNVYNINQPYGFLTVTPRTSNVWAVINTFAFPDQAAHPSVEGIDARQGNFSNLSGDTGSFNNLTVFYSTIMNVATVSSVLSRSISTQSLAVSSNLSARNISTSLAKFSSVTINNPLTPSTSLEVNGSIRASTIFLTNSAYIEGSLVYNTINIVSTVRGLGTATYVSSASLVSTVRGLGTATYVSTASLVSTVQGLGTATYVSTASLVSTVQGLGSSTYVSTASLVSTVQGLGSSTYVSTASLVSTVQGLGTASYISSSSLVSTVQGLGSSTYLSSASFVSTVQGLGTASYVSSPSLVSTVQGLGTASYISSPSLVSTVQGLGTATYISSPSLVSTVQGLGTASYISSPSLVSTVQGLGTASYVSTASLVSTVQGLGTASYISSASIVSTVQGLGSSTYVSSPSLVSTVQGLGTASYVSSPSLVSTVRGLGTATYVSSASLVSTIQGLGTSGYISSPNVVITSLSTYSLTVYGPSTFINASNLFIGSSESTNTLRFIGTYKDGFNEPNPYTNTVIGERIYDEGLLSEESSELLLFKGNNGTLPVEYAPGPDRVRVLAVGGFCVDIASNGGIWPIGGQPPTTAIQAFYIGCNGRVGINCNSPSYTLDVAGTINACNIGIRGSILVTTSNLVSTVQGAGTSGYVSSLSLVSTVQGLGSSSYVSSTGLVSTVQGLGSSSYVSSTGLVSTVQGLGSSQYVSSASLASTVQGLGTSSYVSTFSLVSTVQGLGLSGYISSPDVSISSLSTYSLTVYGPSTFINASNLFIGDNLSTNVLRFLGTYKDGFNEPVQYTTTVIGERIYDEGLLSEESSELLLFKGNNGTLPVEYAPGPDRVRVLSAGGFQIDIASNGGIWPIGGQPPTTAIQAFYIGCNGRVGINCNSPSYTLDVNGSINVSGTINAFGFVNSDNLTSTVQGLGTVSYISSTGLVSTVEGLGTSSYVSSSSLVSTVQGLGQFYMSSPVIGLVSTVQGLGSSGYISSPTVFLSTLSTQSLIAFGESTFLYSSNVYIGNSLSTNILRFYGTTAYNLFGSNEYARTVIAERSFSSPDTSELLLFKANNALGVPGSDNVRVLSAGGFQVDITSNGGVWPINGNPPSTVIQAFTVTSNARVGINCNSPSYTLDVNGSINASGTINARGFVNSDNLTSTVQGLGTVSYVSTASLISTVQGLGSSTYVSSASLVSTVQGLGSSTYVSTASLISTVQGLGTASYVSSASLVSTVQGLGTASYVSSPSLVSTVQGLGTASYISSPSLVSTVQGLGTASYVSSPSLVSTVQGLGTASYVSTQSLVSTVQGLGSSRYISSPTVFLSTLSTQSLIAFGESTFLYSSNVYIGNSLSTNNLRFYGTTAYNSFGSNQYARTVIAERSFSSPDTSELLLFKANNALGVPGPDNVRVLSAGGFQVDIASNGGIWPINGNPPTTSIQAFTVTSNGRVGINCNSPSYTLDVQGSINVSGTINAFGFVNSDNLTSTVRGLGSSQYVSSSALVSTVQGLGQFYMSSPVIGLVSTVQGLGSSQYVSSSALVSTVQGLGSSQYVSSSALVSTVQGLGSSRYISSPTVFLSTLSTQSLIAFGESTFLYSSNVYIGNSLSTNILRFYGTTAYNLFGSNQYARTVIAERSFSSPDTSELLLFKANNALGVPGSDNVRVLAAGGFQVDIASNGGVWPINGNPPSAAIRAFTVFSNGYVGINCNSPRCNLDVNGIVNVSCNIFVNGLPVLTAGNVLSSNYVPTSNLMLGTSPSTNTIRFFGTNLDGYDDGAVRNFTHSVIAERVYAAHQLSELLIFKGDNTGCNDWGPDRVRILAAGGFVVDIAPEGSNWPVNSDPPPAAIPNAFSIGNDGVIRTSSTILINGSRVITSGGAGGGSIVLSCNVGINCNTPAYTLDVGGIIHASCNILAEGSIIANCNIFVNGNPVVTSGGAGGAIVLSCNVGINCNTPAYSLDVNGCLNVSGCNVAAYQWIAVGTGADKILKSSDGYVWSAASGATFTTSGSRVAWNGSNQWIAVGNGTNTILRSTDGNSWTAVTGPTFTAGNDVVWNGTNLWVAVGNGNAANSIWRSANGTSWTASSTGFASGGYGVATSGSYWVAVGNGGSTAANQKYSEDGIIWTDSGSGGFSGSGGGRGVAYNGSNMWVAVGYGSTAANTILYSISGGQLWNNAVTGGFSGGGASVTWNGSLWVATGSHSSAAGNIQISLDGKNWVPSLSGAFSGSGSGVVWSGTKFIATGTGTSPILYSDDGRNWSSENVSGASFTAGGGIGYGRTLTGPLYALTVSGDTYINGTLYINGLPAGAAAGGSGGSGGGGGGGGGSSLPINIELVSSLVGLFGSVGVGCNAPSYSLDVNGTINASSNIFINGSALLAASSMYSTVRGLGSVGYVSSLTNLTNVRNVNSFQGVFSSIGVNCNLPAHRLDVNGKLNVFGDPGFGLIQLQGNGVGFGQETGIFSKDCFVGGLDDCNSGWYYGQSYLNGATLSNFIIRRVNEGGAGVLPAIQITPSGTTTFGGSIRSSPYIIGGSLVSSNGPSTRSELTLWAGTRGYFDWITTNDLSGVAGCGLQLLWYGAENIANPNTLYSVNFCNATTYISGNVGINTINPQYSLDVNGELRTTAGFTVGGSSVITYGGLDLNCTAQGNIANGTNGLTLTSGNGVRFSFYAPDITTGALSSNTFHLWQYGPNSGTGVELLRVRESDTTRKFQWNGAMQVVGTLQKGGGSFTIDHPVVPSTILIHSFIEGPRCDLIYRNRKQLSNGYAEIDIEKECTANDSTMSPGTFEALCTNPQTFLQNNETFDRVKGYVSSHMLFITCENPESTAMIDWQVIAERHDPFIKKWDMTDSNGLLIVEHPKLV